MGKRIKKKFKHSLVLGLFSDVAALVCFVVGVLGWPFRTLAKGIHRHARRHPALRGKHVHNLICVGVGVAGLVAVFLVENHFHIKHPIWSATLETAKAASVCPIWEAVASVVALLRVR